MRGPRSHPQAVAIMDSLSVRVWCDWSRNYNR